MNIAGAAIAVCSASGSALAPHSFVVFEPLDGHAGSQVVEVSASTERRVGLA